MRSQGPSGVSRTRGVKPTPRSQERRNHFLIDINQPNQRLDRHCEPRPPSTQQRCHRVTPRTRAKSCRRSCRHASRLASAAAGLAITTQSDSNAPSVANLRKVSRTQRFTRLRTTAQPTFLLTVTPRRTRSERSLSPSTPVTKTNNFPPPTRRPLSWRAKNCRLLRSRAARGNRSSRVEFGMACENPARKGLRATNPGRIHRNEADNRSDGAVRTISRKP